jgi:putative transposase
LSSTGTLACAVFATVINFAENRCSFKTAQPRVAVLQVTEMTHSYYHRNLPHWQPEGKSIFLTWRLHGSLPKGFVSHLRKWEKEPATQFLTADLKLDAAATGPRWLSDPAIAGYTEDAIRRGAELGHYVLHAYVVMPNHIHVLLDPLVPLRRITGGIKGVSARDANGTLGRTGKAFWQDESFDHWVRNPAQFEKTRAYIENNPVKAGLSSNPQDWPWSSAHS